MKDQLFCILKTITLILLSAVLLMWLIRWHQRQPVERFRIAQFQTEEYLQTTPVTNNSPSADVHVSAVHPIFKIDSTTGETWIYRDEHWLAGRYVGWEELTNLNRNAVYKSGN